MSITDKKDNSQTLVEQEIQTAMDDVKTESLVDLLAMDQDIDFEHFRLNIELKSAELK